MEDVASTVLGHDSMKPSEVGSVTLDPGTTNGTGVLVPAPGNHLDRAWLAQDMPTSIENPSLLVVGLAIISVHVGFLLVA
jgi:hypothetical protein